MKHLHIDATNGIAGDMLLAALIDAGTDILSISEKLKMLDVENFDLKTEQVLRSGISGNLLIINEYRKTHQDSTEHKHKHGPARCLPDIVKLLTNSELPDKTISNALSIFESLAAAEGKIHNKPADKIHFHEISGLDTIIDIVGFCLALEDLKIDSISCSTVSVGTGFVKCAHGKMPLPAPATAELLKGIPIKQLDTNAEICTPTGAAIVSTLAENFGPCPDLKIEKTGYGAGSRDTINQPNIVRVFVGSTADKNSDHYLTDQVHQLVCSVDDLSGEKAAFAIESLLHEGALEAYFKPVIMKKGRPGLELTVLTEKNNKDEVINKMFYLTKTFGLREEIINRRLLQRKFKKITIDNEIINVKVGFLNNNPISFSAEYEDCRKAALKNNLDPDYYYNKAEYKVRNLFEKGSGSE